MQETLRNSGLGVFGPIPWATHLCQFYETKEDLKETLVPFLQAGLESNEYCLWVSSGAMTTGDTLKTMKETVPDTDLYVSSGQFEVLPYTDWYVKNGACKVHNILDRWTEKVRIPSGSGYQGVRLISDTTWLEKEDWNDFMAYEAAVSDAIRGRRLLMLCTYFLPHWGAAEVADAAGKHDSTLIRRDGQWNVIDSRVAERTHELQTAYDTLLAETEERKRVEWQLLQSQKMEAIGTLTGGIAHDFNNILAAIVGFAEIARGRLPEDSDVHRHLGKIYRAGIKGRELVRQMLAFSCHGDCTREPLTLSRVVEEAATVLRASIPATISVRVNVESESGRVLADSVQIQQVVMNLCANSAYAMREKGGVLDLELSDFSVPASSENRHFAKPGLYMKLVVADTGRGIDPDIIDRVFDPFFTTKKPGEGTGLGLSVVQSIVRQHEGYITVESKPGAGATFVVYLPKAIGQEGDETVQEEIIPTGDEQVLFVDDEEGLAEMGQNLLGGTGLPGDYHDRQCGGPRYSQGRPGGF
jgi:signal transduction histidine kinase